MAGRTGLPGSNAGSNDDVTKKRPEPSEPFRRGTGGKRQDVSHLIDAPVLPIQGAHAPIAHESQRHRAMRAARGCAH
jgi:hypothetical protein